MANIGEKIKFTDGSIGTITKISTGDFVGDPRLCTVQYLEDGQVKHTHVLEDRLNKENE